MSRGLSGLLRSHSVLYLLIACLVCTVVVLLNKDECVGGGDGAIGAVPLLSRKTQDYEPARPEAGSIGKVSSRDAETELDENAPLIFIGGHPRSGTTLMRAMLDAHPDVRCGEETRVIPRILGLRANWKRNKKESARLEEAGIDDYVINSAVKAFLLEVIAKHGKSAPRLCNKDPFTIKSATYLSELFPKSKFVFMIRDGRATVHSIITRKVTITGFDLTSYRQCLEKWNQAVLTMYQECYKVGSDRCFPMYYEQLVLHPEAQLRELLAFLDLPWNSSVLHHSDFVGSEISLSKVERSSDQVIKPVNTDALSKWVKYIPEDVKRDMADIAPMLKELGYDPHANPPKYGEADAFVAKNTHLIHEKADYYDERASRLGLARVTEKPLIPT